MQAGSQHRAGGCPFGQMGKCRFITEGRMWVYRSFDISRWAVGFLLFYLPKTLHFSQAVILERCKC